MANIMEEIQVSQQNLQSEVIQDNNDVIDGDEQVVICRSHPRNNNNNGFLLKYQHESGSLHLDCHLKAGKHKHVDLP